MGINVGRDLEGLLPRSYVQARYLYAVVENVEEFGLNRSNADFELGHFATSRLSVRLTAGFQKTYDGLRIPIDNHHHHFHDIHDQATRSNFFRVGGGVSFSLTRTVDLHADLNDTAAGRNGHKPRGLSLGITWRFSRSRSVRVD
jgi:outer membrane autotransporter protein